MTQNSRALRSIIFLLSIVLGSAFSLAARNPVLEWDANLEPWIAGYKFYSGERSRGYDRVIDLGKETSIELSNLDPGITYYFAITAYATNSFESSFSDEVAYTAQIDEVTASRQSCALNISEGTAKIFFRGYAGQKFWVEASTDLSTWERVDSGDITDDAVIESFESTSADKPMRFYRVVASPP